MAKTKITPFSWGPILYRLGFLIFIAGCLLNAYEAYGNYLHIRNNDVDSYAREMIYETWAFWGLAFILCFEFAGITMYKWVRRHMPDEPEWQSPE